MPAFSVVVPAYNASSTLRETLDSVLAQELRDWELVVVDDGSTDDTLAIAREYASKDTRIRALTQENRGSAGAYNAGVAAATADFVTICSSDDLLLPDHLKAMSALIAANPGCDIFSCNGFFQREDGSRDVVWAKGAWLEEHSRSLEQVIGGCFFSVGATYRRSLFDLVGGYRDVYGEDYDFWLRVMARGAKHLYTPRTLSVHRLSAIQKSTDVCRVAESDIRSLTALAESGLLSDAELERVAKSVKRLERRIRELGRTPADRAANEIGRQNRSLHATMARVLGQARADAAMAVARKVSRAVRPFRTAATRATLAVVERLRRR